MDITKFYELRTRLYNTAAAGCMTVSEDFRLKRAVEDFKPLASANKAFEKLYALCEKLFSEATVLPDCIALAEALAITQGTFADNAETTPASGTSVPAQKPASSLALVKELMRKGKPDLWKLSTEYRDVLSDPRIVNAFLNELEETGNFDIFCEIMCEICGRSLVPLLKATVKKSGRQLRYIARISGDEENEFFRALAADENSPEKVRLAAISALSCSPENGALLAELYNTGKAKVKAAALLTMAKIDAPEAEPIFEKLLENYEKNKKTYEQAVATSSGKACTEFVKKRLAELPDELKSPKEYALASDIALLENKTELDDVYLTLSTKKHADNFASARCTDALLMGLAGRKSKAVQALIDRLFAKAPKEFSQIKVFSDFIADPNKEPNFHGDRYNIKDLFGSFTYIPLMGKYYIAAVPRGNLILTPFRPFGERLPDWLIQSVYEIADDTEKLFNVLQAPTRNEMVKKAEELGYKGKNKSADALAVMFENQQSNIGEVSGSINNALLPFASEEDRPRVREAAIYLAEKACACFGGYGAFTDLVRRCPDIDNKKLIDMMNTSFVNTIVMKNSYENLPPLNFMPERFTSDELKAGWKDLRERLSALRGSVDDKIIDEELKLIKQLS